MKLPAAAVACSLADVGQLEVSQGEVDGEWVVVGGVNVTGRKATQWGGRCSGVANNKCYIVTRKG